MFKLKAIDLAAKENAAFSKRISLAEMTTRKHYPGKHAVDVVINGQSQSLGEFHLKA